jgi:hypothetical protein
MKLMTRRASCQISWNPWLIMSCRFFVPQNAQQSAERCGCWYHPTVVRMPPVAGAKKRVRTQQREEPSE